MVAFPPFTACSDALAPTRFLPSISEFVSRTGRSGFAVAALLAPLPSTAVAPLVAVRARWTRRRDGVPVGVRRDGSDGGRFVSGST